MSGWRCLVGALLAVALPLTGGCTLLLDFSPLDAAPPPIDAYVPTEDSGGGCAEDIFDQPNADPPFDNNTKDSAALATAGTYQALQICPKDDQDWFTFGLDAASDVVVEIDFIHRNGDLDLGLYDDAGTEIAVSTGSVDNEKIEMTSAGLGQIGPGNFYVKVFSFSGQFTNTYTLILTVN